MRLSKVSGYMFVFLFIVSVYSTACAQIFPLNLIFGGGKAKKEAGHVMGTIIGPSTGGEGIQYTPIEGATVVLSGPAGKHEKTTDKGGSFYFDSVKEGEYTLMVTKPGYSSTIKKIQVEKLRMNQLKPLTLIPGGGMVTTETGPIPPDTAFIAFSPIVQENDRGNSEMWKKAAILQGADPFALDGNNPMTTNHVNPYDKETNFATYPNTLMTIESEDTSNINYVKMEGNPTWLAFNMSGTKLFAADESSRVSVYDTLHNNIHIGFISVPSPASDLTVSPDGRWLFVCHADGITVMDTQSITPVNNIPAPTMADGSAGYPMGVVCNRSGRLLFMALATINTGEVVSIDAISQQPVERAMVGASPTGIAISADNRYLYVADHNSADVAVLSTSPLSLINRVRVGISPARIVAASDGKVYVSNRGNGTVTVLSPTGAVMGTISVGKEPMGLAVSSDGSRLYVANHGEGTVSIIDTRSGVELKRTKPQPRSRPYGVVVKP